ncbi:uncharacterized protein LOC126187956 isoform X2 [Schistocerca cancellata]|uniref:uncharacterized protein LOC126187956 isoform X2 n=1 Tax=Schistocerca cancellata TaxID=274614 RepID=UPI0021189AE5|nr:uncharacterized protein LOC126187956 isoform X2 [Schistocerca cancellata]
MSDTGKYLVITPEEVAYVRKQLGTNEEDIKKAVTSLREWLRMQPHLPDAVEDSFVERMYINCKCSMERVKVGLDAYFSLKHRFPELLMNRDVRGCDIQFAMKHVKMMTLPRLTKDAYRVHVLTGVDEDPTNIIWPTYGKIVSIGMEVMLVEDYSLGDVLIVDLANVNAGHIVRADINLIHNLEVCYKVFAHLPGSTTLFDYVQRDCVPDELGGTAGPVDNLAYILLKRVNREWLLEKDKYVSDESKRPAENRFGDNYGIAGSFKKLCVD